MSTPEELEQRIRELAAKGMGVLVASMTPSKVASRAPDTDSTSSK